MSTNEYYPPFIGISGVLPAFNIMSWNNIPAPIPVFDFPVIAESEELLRDCLVLLFEDPDNDDLYESIRQRYEAFKRTNLDDI